MNDYIALNEVSSVERAAVRAPQAVASVQKTAPKDDTVTAAAAARVAATKVATPSSIDDEQIASAAEYARIQADIANIIAGLRSQAANPPPTVEGAESAIQGMARTPIFVMPLPPASRDQMQRAAAIARAMAEQASFAQAAQANLRQGMVDQIVSHSA